MRDAVIVDAVRTPIGKRNGALGDWHPVDLSAFVLNALVQRTQLDPSLVDEVLWGVVSQVGEQSTNLARSAALAAGWPVDVTGTTLDRQCGSSQQAANLAASGVMSGQYDIAIAGGVEMMSRVPAGGNTEIYGAPYGPAFKERYALSKWAFGSGDHRMPAEVVVDQWALTRDQLDGYALESHDRAASAHDCGLLEGGIVPVPAQLENGLQVLFSVDEGVRRGGTLEGLRKLKPSFEVDGKLTAASSSQVSDGSAALLITTTEIAKRHGWRPLARFHTFAAAGVDPELVFTGPIPATRKALKRSGLSLGSIGHFEVNEAFASVPLAWLAEIGADPKTLNPMGGAIAFGHPLGGSGAQLMTRLVHGMVQRGTRFGLQTMCEGGGTANATILELLTE